jgi:hypothetical protein
MSSGTKKRNPDTNLLFLSIVSINEHPPVSPADPYGESCPFTGPFLHITEIPHKNFPE